MSFGNNGLGSFGKLGLGFYESPNSQYENKALFVQNNTVNISNTTVESTILGTGFGTKTLAENFLTVDKTLRVTVRGYMNEVSTPTIRVRLKLGSTNIFDSGAVNINNLGGTNKYFDAIFDITCRTVGVNGTVFPQGRWQYTANSGVSYLIDGVVLAASAIDTTISQTIDLTVKWGSASVNNNVNSTNATIEIIN
jgi:hypothetical protein